VATALLSSSSSRLLSCLPAQDLQHSRRLPSLQHLHSFGTCKVKVFRDDSWFMTHDDQPVQQQADHLQKMARTHCPSLRVCAGHSLHVLRPLVPPALLQIVLALPAAGLPSFVMSYGPQLAGKVGFN
jgi:hypothetical protein